MLISFVAASTNLVGKFTQSVRRIVQDVKDEGTASKFYHLFIFHKVRQPVFFDMLQTVETQQNRDMYDMPVS